MKQTSPILSALFTGVIFLVSLQVYGQVDSVKVGSALNKIDSLRTQKLSILDSAQLKLNKTTDKIINVSNSLTSYDTLGQKLKEFLGKRKANLTSKIDSLKSAGLPYDRYSKKLDSLNQINPNELVQKQRERLDAGKAKLGEIEGKTDVVQNKLNEGQSKIQKVQDGAQQNVNEKLDLLSKESQGKGVLPSDVNLGNTKLPEAKLSDAGLNVQSPGLPDINKPALDIGKNPLGDIDTKLDIPEVKTPGELEKVGEVQNKISGEVGEVTEKVSGYSEDVKNISKGNIDEVKSLKQDALAKALLDEEMKALNSGEAMIEEQKAMLTQFKNPEEYKKQLLARGKKMVVKQLAAHQKLLQEATDKVSKYQRTAGTILSKKSDLPKRRDPLKKLRFYEKFVPGLTLQVYKPGAWLVDVNPSLRYRLTSYWSIGSGWHERVIIGDHTMPKEESRVFGLRSFTEVIIFKGLSMRLDAERMNAFITPFLQPKDAGSRQWIWIYMAGIKKEFTFMPRVVGNAQFMYNLYDPDHLRIYPTRFNVRFGFEYPMKRGKKKN